MYRAFCVHFLPETWNQTFLQAALVLFRGKNGILIPGDLVVVFDFFKNIERARK